MNQSETHRRTSSGSTVRAGPNSHARHGQSQLPAASLLPFVHASLWIHDDNFSLEDVLINESILAGTNIKDGDLIKIYSASDTSDVRDFQALTDHETISGSNTHHGIESALEADKYYLCIVRIAPAEFKTKHSSLQISVKNHIANAFSFRSGSNVRLVAALYSECTASHVEFSFRDTYLARSDMWRLVGQELAGTTVYAGQKITYLGTIKLTVKAIHVHHHKITTAYFAGTTIPVFRSDAARYVLFIQMSSEMWDFDSEGNGEIMFNRVINGFLPDLFKRWTDLEVRHLVSIVLFGRLEYDRVDLARNKDRRLELSAIDGNPTMTARHYQDFYRVVVTDMASAQWTTILNELKKDFRVFLKDISLHTSQSNDVTVDDGDRQPVRIAGKPSTALKGNILEAINVASTQFAHDFEDRDLIRTGISVVVITAGTGVFEVKRDLLNITSQNLTNNGVGIDIVCLSRMPLHSVPLFKYRTPGTEEDALSSLPGNMKVDESSQSMGPSFFDSTQPRKLSPAVSSATTNSMRYLASFISRRGYKSQSGWSYGIPHWVDLSYWSPEPEQLELAVPSHDQSDLVPVVKRRKELFVPRVRMYEIQMMGLMELGMADMSVPYISETQEDSLSCAEKRSSGTKRPSGGRTLSQSPKLSRGNRPGSNPTRLNAGLISTNAESMGSAFVIMDAYDAALFEDSDNGIPKQQQNPRAKSHASQQADKPPRTISSHSPEDQKSVTSVSRVPTNKSLNSPFRPQLPSLMSADASSPTPTSSKTAVTPRVNRTLSYALRGLAPPIRAVASTKVNVTNAQAQPTFGSLGHSQANVATTAASIGSASPSSIVPDMKLERVPTNDHLSISSHKQPGQPSTKPISITTPLRKVRHGNSTVSDTSGLTPMRTQGNTNSNTASTSSDHGSETASSSPSDRGASVDDNAEHDSQLGTSLTNSVPKSTLPFIRNINASNPLKRNPEKESTFGRWQHLYPRKPRASIVKWRSLCTPASVPLTTEDFPTREELDTEYSTVGYIISIANANEMLEEPESRDVLLREMLALRFAHGYQLVVGSSLLQAVGPGTSDSSSFFTPNIERPDGSFIVMSMGNTFQKLTLLQKDHISVTKYIRRPPDIQPPLPQQINYFPNIRTILAKGYKIRDMQFNGFSEQYPWETADNFLANKQRRLDVDVGALRFWRARFVLIPVEPPGNAWRPTPTEPEENEEEIHLRGIRALTQLWQKSRFVPPEERRPTQNRLSTMKRKDRNPLSINLETLNPSELVATELDKLIAAEEAGETQATQLLPEAEQFDRDSFNLPKLAQALQGENGIEIQTRRWHWRLHYSCFVGEDLTNWLVYNFRDIETREEAVELGNDLMKESLFEHVNGKHRFKDGNFFYSIKAEHRAQRSEDKPSWFPASRKSDRSIPPTPATEYPSREHLTGRSRSGSNLVSQIHGQAASEISKTFNDKKQRTVTLSKMIRIDVDTRKRSNRPEIVNLHYDRLHNPENCYHLELSWLNVTSKLVDDAIGTWTTQAEKYGLKLVEVPIAEAFKVPEHEPFRAAYRIHLAREPPERSVANTMYFTAASFGPQAPLTPDVHYYHKALLKRFNFVLDLEAPSEFPENVEIKYSWGELDYKYTQFVHRSGVILAQITNEGDILLLANRLYNSRQASSKDTAKFDNGKKNIPIRNTSSHLSRPQTILSAASAPMPSMSASGIIGLNMQSPQTGPFASPLIRPLHTIPDSAPNPLDRISRIPGVGPVDAANLPAPGFAAIPSTPKVTADVLGPSARGYRGQATGASHAADGAYYITPEHVKDDLEAFCSDAQSLKMFYQEVIANLPAQQAAMKERERIRHDERQNANGGPVPHSPLAGNGSRWKSAKTSSSVLRPVKEPESGDTSEIPELNLPDPKYVNLNMPGPRRQSGGKSPASG